jgi:hypothetical protein
LLTCSIRHARGGDSIDWRIKLMKSIIDVEGGEGGKRKGLKTNMMGGGKLPEDWWCTVLIVSEKSNSNHPTGIKLK